MWVREGLGTSAMPERKRFFLIEVFPKRREEKEYSRRKEKEEETEQGEKEENVGNSPKALHQCECSPRDPAKP